MPINLRREEPIEEQLERLGYGDGLEIKEAVHEHLYTHPRYYFTADEMSARIQPVAAPVQIEAVLSKHPEEFSYKKHNEKLYWQLNESSTHG